MIYRVLIIFASLLFVGCTSKGEPTLAPIVNAWAQLHAQKSVHQVERGETLYSIAWAYGVDYRELATINNLESPYTLSLHQKN